MKWFADFFAKKKVSSVKNVGDRESFSVSSVALVPNPMAVLQKEMQDKALHEELFNLCWEREALYVEIDTAKRHKKKSSHLIEALAKNTARRLEIEMAHNGKRA